MRTRKSSRGCLRTGVLEEIVEFAELFSGLDVGLVLRWIGFRLVASNESEEPDVLVKLFERELDGVFVRIEVVEADTGEVGDDDVTREVALLEAVEVVRGLVKRAVEIASARFVLDEEDALPEQVDEATLPSDLMAGFSKRRLVGG